MNMSLVFIRGLRYFSVSRLVCRTNSLVQICSQSLRNKSSYDDTSSSSKAPDQSQDEFTGVIPIDDLQITYSRSSGPGGQNVNKVNTKVEVRFNLSSAKWIPQSVKTKLMEREAGRITKDGFFVVSSDKTRRQMLNQADCLARLRSIIFDAANDKPYEPTAEELEVLRKRQAKAKAGVLREKRSRALVKAFRGSTSSDSL